MMSKVTSALMAGSDREQARKLTKSLRCRIESEWAYLLRKHDGEVVEQPQPGGRTVFDYASCVVRFSQLEMLVSEGRGEVYVQVRSSPQAHWADLTAVLGAQTPRPQAGLAAFEEVIARSWSSLVDHMP
ncbi:hypothetical protein [Terriglobus sp.]|uniref:hypothetical protein n=1 Tax=Terriglobus sp. TaxID=1889013 RepID=UPI003AFFECA0